MRKELLSMLMVVIVIGTGCTLLGNDNGTSGTECGWRKTNLPKNLTGKWYINDIFDIEITSSTITMDNRKWSIDSIEKSSDEYRIVGRSDRQYRAFYFKNITEVSTEKAVGYIAYVQYDAKEADKSSWVTITKK